MGLQITASKSALLLQCPRPFAPDTTIDDESNQASEGARWGSAAHLCLDEKRVTGKFSAKSALVKYGFEKPSPKSIGDLENQVNAGWSVLQAWLKENSLRIVSGEMPLAYRLDTGQRRLAHFEEDGHRYGLSLSEIGGTPDLLLEGRNPIRKIILDYKTGDFELNDFSKPEDNAQLLTLALMTGADEVAVLHMPLGSIPIIYHAEVDAARLQKHLDNLAVAADLASKSSPAFMRVGKECKYCPARFGGRSG